MLCLYLDLNALSPADLMTAQEQAVKFVREQATDLDQVAVMTFGSKFTVLQDFTNDRDKLVGALRAIVPQQAVNTDASARLQAIQAAAMVLENLPQKKAMLYFSTGIPSPAQAPDLRSTLTALINANVAVYPVDVRNLR